MAKTQSKIKNAKLQSPKPARGLDSAAGVASNMRLKGLICLLLIVITLVAYWQVLGCKFIEFYDDQLYVTTNTHIAKGLNADSLAWAFTTFRCGNWHPLTWLSHMADYQIHGLDPAGHHLTNLLFHIANTLILFLVLSRMTGAVWKSGFVAALFAVHPLHVESVAWVAERKDVLSTFLWLATMYAYLLYAKRPSIARYIPVMLAFGLGLLAKPMLVSLPLALLLLDYWPLNRLNLRWRLVWEKAPLLAMSTAACIVTVMAQKSGGTLSAFGWLPFGFRLGNAAVSYIGYIVKMLWPSHLAVLYPHPGVNLPIWQAICAGLLLIATSFAILRHGRRYPYLAVGWLWYLVALVPVIGLVQVGLQAMADRYSYISMVGLFIIIAWGVPDLLARPGSVLRRLIPISASVLIVLLAACTWFQVRVWQDSYSLFDHAVAATKDNFVAYNLRGLVLESQGVTDQAISDLSKAVEIQPGFTQGHYDLGSALITNGQAEEGISHLLTDLDLGYDLPKVHHHLALGYYALGKFDLAAEQCQITLQRNPRFPDSRNIFGAILYQQHKIDEAIAQWQSAAELSPAYPDPHGNLATAYFVRGDYAAAWSQIHLFESDGGQPNPQLVANLSKRMPDPSR